MFVAKREYYEEVTVLLQLGVDFEEKDLVPNALVGGQLKELSSTARNIICFNNGYLSTQWAGHYDEESKTVKVVFRKPVFIDTESNKCLF